MQVPQADSDMLSAERWWFATVHPAQPLEPAAAGSEAAGSEAGASSAAIMSGSPRAGNLLSGRPSNMGDVKLGPLLGAGASGR